MSDERGKILVVEDDPSLAMGLKDALEFEGYRVTHADRGQNAIDIANSEKPDCVLLDLMLPDLNGYEVCEAIRKTHPLVPILMLTARSQESDKIRGLDSGADDYVTKPFAIGELVARIRALLRRSQRSDQTPDHTLRIGESVIDTNAQTLTRGDSVETLSFYEVELLKMLSGNAGQPVSRDEILKQIWGIDPGPNNRTVDNFILKLRRKLEPHPDRPTHILTVYGTGYKLVA